MDDSSIFPGYDSVEEYSKAVLRASLSCSIASTEIDADLYEYGNTFKGFTEAMSEQRDILLSLIKGLIPGQKLQDEFESLDEDLQMDFLRDINSSIFENVSCLLEETDGEKKPEIELVVTTKTHIPINTSWNKKNFSSVKKNLKTLALLSAKNIVRPQLAFKDKVDNSNAIFEPIIKEKPNAIRPLAIVLEKDDEGNEEFCHPYECELDKFESPPEQLETCEPVVPQAIEQTPLVYVDTVESLDSLWKELKQQKEIAVDIEHHSYRSYQGFSCLMQMSTRQKDYIIDCLALRSDLWILNEVFTDTNIVKVFHGADMDILWLQRDFGLYVVNMFDTGQAARVLNFAHLSLAYLMKHYCNVQPDKQFQLADWRIRPLPEELLNYAREDTHYLLYIYDCMKNELVNKGNNLKNLLCSVFKRSKEICLKKYKKVPFTDDKYLELYRKNRKNFNPRQLFCLKELYAWREKIARIEDESCGYILPNHMLLQICEVLPRDHQGVQACCNPIPPFVLHHLNDLYTIVSKANNYSLAQLQEPQNTVQTHEIRLNVDLNNVLHCPHDIHSYDDTRMHFKHFSENATSIIQGLREVLVPLKDAPSLSFGSHSVSSENSKSKEIQEMVEVKIKKANKTFYERFLLTQKYRASMGLDEDNNTSAEKEKDTKTYIAPQSVPESTQQLGSQSDVEIIELEESVPANIENHTLEEQVREESPEISELATIPKKGKKRKKNKNETNSQTNESSSCPRKKSKTPDSSFDNSNDTFKPFDYSKADYNSVKKNSGKKHKKQSFKPHEEMPNFRTGNKHNRRRRGRGKQASFSSSGTNSGGRNWPKV